MSNVQASTNSRSTFSITHNWQEKVCQGQVPSGQVPQQPYTYQLNSRIREDRSASFKIEGRNRVKFTERRVRFSTGFWDRDGIFSTEAREQIAARHRKGAERKLLNVFLKKKKRRKACVKYLAMRGIVGAVCSRGLSMVINSDLNLDLTKAVIMSSTSGACLNILGI